MAVCGVYIASRDMEILLLQDAKTKYTSKSRLSSKFRSPKSVKMPNSKKKSISGGGIYFIGFYLVHGNYGPFHHYGCGGRVYHCFIKRCIQV